MRGDVYTILVATVGLVMLVSCGAAGNAGVQPSVALAGDQTIELYVGQRYVEPGFKAIDAGGTDVSSQIEVEGSVETDYAGTHRVTYSLGGVVLASRTVTVLDRVRLSYWDQAIDEWVQHGPQLPTATRGLFVQDTDAATLFYGWTSDRKLYQLNDTASAWLQLAVPIPERVATIVADYWEPTLRMLSLNDDGSMSMYSDGAWYPEEFDIDTPADVQGIALGSTPVVYLQDGTISIYNPGSEGTSTSSWDEYPDLKLPVDWKYASGPDVFPGYFHALLSDGSILERTSGTAAWGDTGLMAPNSTAELIFDSHNNRYFIRHR